MDPRLQTSFIPKKPILAQQETRSPRTINLLSLLATILFVLAVAISAATFLYNNLLIKQIAANKDSLDKARGAFDPELIQQMIRRDTRIETSKNLLKSHLSITPFFDLLASITLKSVRFRDFSFTYLASDKILVSMKGQARDYASVALESDLLNQQKYLKGTVLGDMSLEPTGTVGFTVSTTVDPALISYQAALSRGSINSSAPAPTAPVASSTKP